MGVFALGGCMGSNHCYTKLKLTEQIWVVFTLGQYIGSDTITLTWHWLKRNGWFLLLVCMGYDTITLTWHWLNRNGWFLLLVCMGHDTITLTWHWLNRKGWFLLLVCMGYDTVTLTWHWLNRNGWFLLLVCMGSNHCRAEHFGDVSYVILIWNLKKIHGILVMSFLIETLNIYETHWYLFPYVKNTVERQKLQKFITPIWS